MGLLCDMQLETPQTSYQPGDVLSGRIMVTLDERALMKALGLKISGYAAIHWEKPAKDKKSKKSGGTAETKRQKPSTVYSNREDYLSTINYFIGSDAASAKLVEPGSYHYNFSVRLPDNCTTSFESTFGHIRYEMDVFIEYPDHRHSCYSRHFHVRRPYDMQNIPALEAGYNVEKIEKKSFVKFWQRPLQLQVNIPKIGYSPGEAISVHTKVLNYDLLTLTEIIYKLNLVGTYTGFFKKKANMHLARTNLLTATHSLFGQNGNVVQHLQSLHVPDTPPTLNVADCHCLQISYEIEVIVVTSQKNRHISALMPLTIGTVSLQHPVQVMPRELTMSTPALTAALSMNDIIKAQEEHPDAFPLPSAPTPETPTSTAPVGLYPLITSSSFREADFMPSTNKKKKHSKSMENLDDFKPKYLYYDMQNAAQQSQAPSSTSNNNNINEKTRF